MTKATFKRKYLVGILFTVVDGESMTIIVENGSNQAVIARN